jgi:hypothetical protein
VDVGVDKSEVQVEVEVQVFSKAKVAGEKGGRRSLCTDEVAA